MSPPAEIYDRAFFSEYGAANRQYAESCAFVAGELYRRFQPGTVVDWGCGAGLHAAELARRGAEVIAVDAVQVDDDLRAPLEVRVADLTDPLVPAFVPDRYDLSLCLDVMEHLPAAAESVALTHVTRGAQVVVLSCAPPNQGGHHHINEQPRRYWIARMAELGWHYDQPATGAMWQWFKQRGEQIAHSWMFHNLCIYRSYPVPRSTWRRRKRARSG